MFLLAPKKEMLGSMTRMIGERLLGKDLAVRFNSPPKGSRQVFGGWSLFMPEVGSNCVDRTSLFSFD